MRIAQLLIHIIRIKAIFSWTLTEDSELKFPSIIQVPGNPLDLVLSQSDTTKLPSVVVAIDTSSGDGGDSAHSLNVYDLTTNEGKLAVETARPVVYDAEEATDLNPSLDEITSLLYGLENQRKMRVGAGAGAEAEAEADEEPED